jgi:hypothetical protein
MKRVLPVLVALLALALPAGAHIGSPDVFLESNAGPYRLFVTVRVPQVIPGVAQVEIRSESNDVSEIRIAPMQLTGPGSQFPPTPDVAQQSKADPQFFTGSIWLMEFGSLQVRIDADGTRGEGELAVPVPAMAQRTLPMQRPLGIALFALLSLLAFALVSIASAAVREGNLEPGAAPGPANVRRARIAAAIASLAVISLLWIGRSWWNSNARSYASNVYSPPEIQASLDPAGQLVLQQETIKIAEGNPRRPTEVIDFDHLVPDHDHLMHLFLVRTPGMDSMWHLHPQRAEDGGFATALPAVSAGHYQIFADVVLNTGFPVTLLGQIDLPEVPGRGLTGDDSGTLANPLTPDAPDTTASPLAGGGQMVWERTAEPLKANVSLIFRFRVEDDDGNPAADLEPYMGMAAHAEIIRSDSSVFAHVHPAGSISMAAFELAQASLPGTLPASGRAGMAGMAMPKGKVSPEISFPYGFPKPGLYRIFVQIKRSGQIQTGVFDTTVQ